MSWTAVSGSRVVMFSMCEVPGLDLCWFSVFPRIPTFLILSNCYYHKVSPHADYHANEKVCTTTVHQALLTISVSFHCLGCVGVVTDYICYY